MFTRRAILTTAAMSLVAVSIAAAPASAQKVNLTFGHGAAPGNPRSVAADKFAEIVKEQSQGRIDVQVAGSARLGDDQAMITAMRTGTLDMSANSQGPSAAVVPEMAAIGLPFLFNDLPQAWQVLDGPVGKELAEKFEKQGLIVLAYWDNGIRHVTNIVRPISAPDDLKGIKIRTPADPITIDIFQTLGSSTQQIRFSELYVALQQGVVDGQENPVVNIYASKLYEVQKYLSLTGHKYESTPVFASKITFRRLSPEDQQLLRDAAVEAGKLQRQLMVDSDKEVLAEIKKISTMQVNDVDRKPFLKAVAPVFEKWEAQPFGDFVKRVEEAAKVARGES
jgi:TRAP-type transport system periplasmic protein